MRGQCLTKRIPESCLGPSTMGGHNLKASLKGQVMGPHQIPNGLASILILGSKASEIVNNKFLLFESYSVWGLLLY